MYNICTTPAQSLRRWAGVVQMLYTNVSNVFTARSLISTAVQFLWLYSDFCNQFLCKGGGTGAVVKAADWKVGDRGFEPHSGLQVSKKENVSSPLTRKDLIL